MAYITNFDNFSPEDCFIEFPNQETTHPWHTTIQKSSINTVGGFCQNPFGAVSNLDCPDWDPACNCWVTQFMPEEKEPSGISLAEMKKRISECFFIQKTLTPSKEWMGIDYAAPQCQYNCLDKSIVSSPQLQYTPVDFYKISGDGVADGSTFPYSIGLSGASGMSFIAGYSADAIPDTLKTADWKICGGCFPHYLEYSKTNATFWYTSPKTPLLRKAQMGAYNSQKIKILVNGDRRVKIGMLVNLSMPIGDETGDEIAQKRFSGRWMIYRIERIFTANKHSMYLFLMRDGYSIEPAKGLDTTSNSTSGRSTDAGGG